MSFLNSLGVNTWENSFSCVGLNGRWVGFSKGREQLASSVFLDPSTGLLLSSK